MEHNAFLLNPQSFFLKPGTRRQEVGEEESGERSEV